MDASPNGSSWLLEKGIELATFVGGAVILLWKVATMVSEVQSEVKQLKDDVVEQARTIEKINQKQELRHEQNLNAIYSRPDKIDFQRFQDQIMQQLNDLKHALTGR